MHSIGKNKFILTFVDNNSRYCMVYLLKDGSETFELIEKYVIVSSNKFGGMLAAN